MTVIGAVTQQGAALPCDHLWGWSSARANARQPRHYKARLTQTSNADALRSSASQTWVRSYSAADGGLT